MSVVLGVNGAFHDPAAALLVDGLPVAAAEEERFSRRADGRAVPPSSWELPFAAISWCLAEAGVDPDQVDAVAYSYDPSFLAGRLGDEQEVTEPEDLRRHHAHRAPRLIGTAVPGLDGTTFVHVPHHVAHAASAHAASPFDCSATLVLDGRGERTSYLAAHGRGADLELLADAELPNSLGLVYEELTDHLGYRRSSDEHKVMALASYGVPRHLERLRSLIRSDGRGSFCTDPIDWTEFCARGQGDGTVDREHADLASSVQTRLEEVVLDLAWWLHEQTGEEALTLAGGVARNAVANSRLFEEGPFHDVWVQPAAGDAGTALGAAYHVAGALGDAPRPMGTAALGRGWSDRELERELRRAGARFEQPADPARAAAQLLAGDAIVGWFQGRSEFGPRALAHRSLLAHPGHWANTERLNDIKGREQFRPVAPMVLDEAAPMIFEGGPLPSPYMLFTHRVRPGWADRIPAAVHVDGTARAQTVGEHDDPLVHRLLTCFQELTGLPVLINTSFDNAGRPMVDSPRDALDAFASAPIDALVIGPFVVRRADR